MEISKKQFISDLEVGGKADTIFIVANKHVRKKKDGKTYCAVTLQDRAGSIEGVLWTEVYCNTKDFAEGDFVLVRGDVKEYKGCRQLVIGSIIKIESKENIDYSDYIKTSGENIDEMFKRIKKYIAGIEDPHLKKLLDLFFEDKKFENDFKNSAAAVRYHHAFRGGLLEHTLSVTEICDAVYRIYRNLDYDLLISGAILHDIGKIREYRTKVTTEVTDEGRLLGHIIMGYGLVLEKIKEIDGFPADLSERLLHIVLSHHGQKEFGSPKRPRIPEAFIVYHVDYMDADIGGYNIAMEENKSGNDWSDYLRNFDRSVFLKKLDKPGDKKGDGIKSIKYDGQDDDKGTSIEKGQEELF
ncbi:MAG: HD domain-containing protein [Actinomycetota bacterium]|nr:HD domain-containing protein [Actinomycetota bacterium]